MSVFLEDRVIAAKRLYLFSTGMGMGMGAGMAAFQHEILGNTVRQPLRNDPTATRDTLRTRGRIPDLSTSGELTADWGSQQINLLADRATLCGITEALASMKSQLQKLDFQKGSTTEQGDFVVQRAFLKK